MGNMCRDYLITLTTDDEVIELALVKGKGVAFDMWNYFKDLYKGDGEVGMIPLKRKRLNIYEITE